MSATAATIPIQRADGTQLYNSYLWPTESWWLGHEHPHFHSRWHFQYVALMDGRFCVSGFEWEIRDNKSIGWDRKNNFPTREAAIRASAARMIRCMRHSHDWGCFYGGLRGEQLEFAINWALERCYKVCNQGKPRRVTVALPPPPPPPPPKIQTKAAAEEWSDL